MPLQTGVLREGGVRRVYAVTDRCAEGGEE